MNGTEEIPAGRFYVQIFYNDKPLFTPACRGTFDLAFGKKNENEEDKIDGIGTCDFLDFLEYVERETLSDWENECAKVGSEVKVNVRKRKGEGLIYFDGILFQTHRILSVVHRNVDVAVGWR